MVKDAAAAVTARLNRRPAIGIVLGSGLGAFGDALGDVVKIPYADIPHMPCVSVPGHAGNVCVGQVGDATVACLQGRVHLYEGHPPARVVFGVRLLAALGCRAVLLTNAAGGIGAGLSPGDLMLITDHLNLTGQNPLVSHDPAGAPQFPDMTHAYDPALSALARRAADAQGLVLKQGVYAGLLGPSYETPAEIRMIRQLGADAVGMSTVSEVIALRQLGVPVAAVSCITNLAAGLGGALLDHADVQRVARETRARFVSLLNGWVDLIQAEWLLGAEH
jgi:purine-nucleoside phosphorylase